MADQEQQPPTVGDERKTPPVSADTTEERPSKRLRMTTGNLSEESGVALGDAAPNDTATPIETAQESSSSDPVQVTAPAADDKPKPSGNGTADSTRRQGVAPIKAQYLLPKAEKVSEDTAAASGNSNGNDNGEEAKQVDDRDANGEADARDGRKKKGDKRKKERGQNIGRSYGRFEEEAKLCNTRALTPEFSPEECTHGDKCKLSHNLREYLEARPKEDTSPVSGVCPLYELFGQCPTGWKCRYIKHHMATHKHDDGREELVLTRKDSSSGKHEPILTAYQNTTESSVKNVVGKDEKINLNRRRVDFSKADQYGDWLDKEAKINDKFHHRVRNQTALELNELRASFVDPPFLPSEKRKLYFGPETPLLAPLTTQGNMPFRRLCIDLGAQLTYSEMAMAMPLLQGNKSDWTLLKAHESEITPPTISPDAIPIVEGYDHSRDLKFGAQISGHSHRHVTRAADILNRYCPHLRLIDLNCGCPIDMVYKAGAGAGILDSAGKLERMVRGMNAVSGEVPITVKLRTGVRSDRPVATNLIGKLAFGAREHRERLGAPGCAAVTLHGRSREQRYTKKANWSYIAECSALVKTYNKQLDEAADTAAEPDARSLANAKDGKMYFLGNGDCYSHFEYYDNLEKSRVDSIMIGRGALIKPWIFEEIQARQYLDKSSSERLEYVKRYVDYGLEAWGSDDIGVGYTRRFLLEWLSFAHRYVPIGLLEHLPPDMNDRPAAYVGRDEFETKLASKNYKDWISISEHYLGKASTNFRFEPKHKSNAWEAGTVEG